MRLVEPRESASPEEILHVQLFEQIVEIVHRFVENNVVFIRLIFNCKSKLNSTTYDDGYRRDPTRKVDN